MVLAKLRAARVILALAATVLLLELAAVIRPPPTVSERYQASRRAAARRAGLPVDPRTRREVVTALRSGGGRAFPVVAAAPLREYGARTGQRLVPVSGPSNAMMVLCAEQGPWVVFRSDSQGFRNPADLWNPGAVPLVAVGDSYVEGVCAKDDETLVAGLRRGVPGAVGLALSGAGPLVELAIVREYGALLRPRLVLWFYYEENDLMNLEGEMRSPVLRRYLDPDGSQNLAARRAEVDRFVEAAVTAVEDSLRTAASERGSWRRFAMDVARLGHVRRWIGTVRDARRVAPCCDLATLHQALARADTTVRSWGGRLVFVYVPTLQGFTRPPERRRPEVAARDDVLAVARGSGLVVIDLKPALAALGDPRDVYVFEGGHMTPLGYAAAARIVLDSLRARGFMAGAAPR